MPSYPSPARRCLDLAAAAAPALIGRVIEQAVAAMQQEELQSPDVRQRQELAEAWLALSQQRADWMERFPALLGAAQQAMGEQAPALLGIALGAREWLGTDALWLSFPLGMVATMLMATALYLEGSWKKARMAPEECPDEIESREGAEAVREPGGALNPAG